MSLCVSGKFLSILTGAVVFLTALSVRAEYKSRYINPFGNIQGKWEYQNPLEGNSTEKNQFFLRALELGSYGQIDEYVSYKFEFHYDNWEDFWGVNQMYLQYSPFANGYLRLGYLEKTNFDSGFVRPRISKLWEKEGVWTHVMEDEIGFSGYDLALLFEYNMEKLRLSLGAFNAFARSDAYNPQREDDFWNNPVKNGMLQAVYQSGQSLKLYSNFQLLGRPDGQKFFITSYDPVGLLGFSFNKGYYQAQLQAAMGYNHFSLPQYIGDGSQLFIAWKLSQKASWKITSDYVVGAIVLWEGADPAVSNELDYTNDASFRYSYALYVNNHWAALSLGHNILQKLDASISKKANHQIESRLLIYF